MFDFVVMNVNCLFVGFAGGLCGVSIALYGLKGFFVRHYMRYSRTKDYINLHNKVHFVSTDIKTLKKQISLIQKDIYELYQEDNKNEAAV